MTKKTRLIILLVCVACFLVVSPVLVLYSMGYRLDFEKMRVTATGGIYVRSFPSADKIIIDSKISDKPGLFSNSIFVQSLLPKYHTVLVNKTGYYDYSKTILVQEKEVTKLENILLFKKDIQFETVTDPAQSPFIAEAKSAPAIKKSVAFSAQGDNILWLGTDGLLYKSDLLNTTSPTKITVTPLKMAKTGTYDVIADNKDVFVNNNGSLLILNSKTNELDPFYSPIKGAKISPDGKNIIYYDSNNIYISPLPNSINQKITLYNSAEKISNCIWLNNSYIIFTVANKVIISEIDFRGSINAITLPVQTKNPQIFFNQQDSKLYVLSGNSLLISEKLIP